MGQCLSQQQQLNQHTARPAAAKPLQAQGAEKPERFVMLFGDGRQPAARAVGPKHGDAEPQAAKKAERFVTLVANGAPQSATKQPPTRAGIPEQPGAKQQVAGAQVDKTQVAKQQTVEQQTAKKAKQHVTLGADGMPPPAATLHTKPGIPEQPGAKQQAAKRQVARQHISKEHAFTQADRFVTLVGGGVPRSAASPPTRPAAMPEREQTREQQAGLDGAKGNSVHTAGDTPAKQLWRQWKAARQAAARKSSGQGGADSDRFVVLFAGGKLLPAQRAAEPVPDEVEQQPAEQRAAEELLAKQQVVEHHAAEGQAAAEAGCGATCCICFEDDLPRESMYYLACQHEYCRDCLRQHVTVAVEDARMVPRCPQPDCRHEMDVAALRSLLTPEEWTALLDVAAEAILPADERLYCPYASCSALMIRGPNFGKPGVTSCPHCKGRLCGECGKVPHPGADCAAAAAGAHLASDKELLELAKRENWQQCPKCRSMVERTYGCNFMVCKYRGCGTRSCYQCGKQYQSNDHYSCCNPATGPYAR